MNKLVRHAKVFLERNASTILTTIGGVGVVTTSVLAVKATPKAMRLVEKAEEAKGEKLTKFETIKVAGPSYIPAVVTGAATIACIFGANALNKRQQAALMSAYALIDNSYKEYKRKVVELYGQEAADAVQAEIASDKYEESDISVAEGKELFFDSYSGRYFESTLADVRKAECEINRELNIGGYACINELYDMLGMPHIEGGSTIGWSTFADYEMFGYSWVDFLLTKATIDDDIECTIVDMQNEPYADFMHY